MEKVENGHANKVVRVHLEVEVHVADRLFGAAVDGIDAAALRDIDQPGRENGMFDDIVYAEFAVHEAGNHLILELDEDGQF